MAVYTIHDMTTILIDDVHVSKEALNLAVKLCGSREQVYKDILFVYTGVSDFRYFEEELNLEE